MTAPATATERTKTAETGGIWHRVRTLSSRMAMLTAAATAGAAYFLPESALPDPLSPLREWGVPAAMLALVCTWVWPHGLHRQRARIAAATFALLVSLIGMRLLFVKPVHYDTTVGDVVHTDTAWFITGWAVADPSLEDLTAEDLILKAGGGWDELRAVWGRSFDVTALAYGGLYLLVIAGFILCVGGAEPAAGGRPRGGKARSDARPEPYSRAGRRGRRKG